MSITASYRRLSPEEFERLQSDPEAAVSYFNMRSQWSVEDITATFNAELKTPLVPHTKKLPTPENLTAFAHALEKLEKIDRYLDIHKSWQTLHFLLTGRAGIDRTQANSPLDNVVLGGTNTHWKATYDMVRYLKPEEVRDSASALEEISEDDLRQRFDIVAFASSDLYNGSTWNAERLEELLHVFAQVCTFFSEAASAGEIVLLSTD